MQSHHVYGPVPSRRLGRSLGIDVIPFKTCTYDCTYCQLGHTTCHTCERREYVPVDLVLSELKEHLQRDTPDIISFAGSGEPTLNSGLGRCIAGIKEMTSVPVAVFTNASLLWMPEVRADLALADIVSPSLDAALPRTAEQVNRLAAGLDLQQILEGLATFCAEYTGQIWLEVLLCRSVNDSRDDLEALKGVLRRLVRVDRVQLNTATRPPADRDIAPLDREALQRVADEIQRDTPWPCEIIASFPKTSAHEASSRVPGRDEVLELVRCHPSTVQGIAAGLDVEQAGVAPVVDALLADGLFECEEREGETYYFVREDETRDAQ